MNKNSKLFLLQQWQKCYEQCLETEENLETVFDNVSETVFDSTWKMFDTYTKTLSEMLGDTDEWLFWYCFDNEMGKNRLQVAEKNKPTKTISCLKDLVELLPNEPVNSETSLCSAYDTLCKTMKNDPMYANSWQANIAMPICDVSNREISYKKANKIADYLMKHLFNVDMSLVYKKLEQKQK